MKSKILFIITVSLFAIACVNTTQEEILKDPEIKTVTLNYSQVNKTLFIAAEVTDPQGLDNIASVPYTLYRRDSINAINETIFDEGHYLVNNGNNGDIINGDNIFSFLIDSDTLAGNEGYYRVVVQAFDTDGNSSNIAEEEELVAPNSPPVLYPISVPKTFEKGDTLIFKIRVTDPQGAGDIASLTYSILLPNNRHVTDPSFFLCDNGKDSDNYGDEIANDGIYTVHQPTNSESTLQGDYIFKFVAEDNFPEASDTLEATMTNPGVHLLTPDTAETLHPFEYYTITWESAYINKVALAYTINANASPPDYETIDTVYAATNSYEWAVPYPIGGDATYCKVKITDAAHSSRSDESDETFRIIP